MALIECNFGSNQIGLQTAVTVLLPERRLVKRVPSDGKWPVLYLLHGLSDDHTMWMRRTSLERYVEGLPLAVVMPEVARTWYSDVASGPKYFQFVSQELPELMAEFFPISTKREKNFVCGLSMGGYGSFKMALTFPERFAAAASLSGALDIAPRFEGTRGYGPERVEMTWALGNPAKVRGGPADLLALATKVVKSGGPIPKLLALCGTEDFLLEENRKFRDHAAKLKLALEYDEGPGAHTWDYWDRTIQRVIEWLPFKR